MTEEPYTITIVPTTQEIADALMTKHAVFPVLNMSGQLVGQITSNFLVVLLRE